MNIEQRIVIGSAILLVDAWERGRRTHAAADAAQDLKQAVAALKERWFGKNYSDCVELAQTRARVAEVMAEAAQVYAINLAGSWTILEAKVPCNYGEGNVLAQGLSEQDMKDLLANLGTAAPCDEPPCEGVAV